MSTTDIADIIYRLDKLEQCVRRFSNALIGDKEMEIKGFADRLADVEKDVKTLVNESEQREATNRGIKIGLMLTGGGTVTTAIFTGLSFLGVL